MKNKKVALSVVPVKNPDTTPRISAKILLPAPSEFGTVHDSPIKSNPLLKYH